MPNNADTDAPNDNDVFIDTMCDLQQASLRWAEYIHRLRNGAWGDHLAIQSICNEFNVAINVLSSEHSNMTRIVPSTVASSGSVERGVYIGLVLQFHYVGLDKLLMPEKIVNESESITTTDTNSDSDPLNDNIIADRDENLRQITGGPMASMMSLENPETFVSIAPAEGQKPLSIMTDTNFEAMVNPDKFCFGN